VPATGNPVHTTSVTTRIATQTRTEPTISIRRCEAFQKAGRLRGVR
jgi:hypothetical protein